MPMTSTASLMTTGSNPSRSETTIAIRLMVSASVPSSARKWTRSLVTGDKLRGIEGIGALAQDLALRSALTAGAQEGGHVLEVVGRDVARQRLRRRQWLPVSRQDVADLPLRDRDQ